MSETYPRRPLRNAFRRTYFPPAQESRAKVVKICEMSKKKSEKIAFRFNGRPLNARKRATVQCLEAGNICQATGKNLTCGGNLLGGKPPSTKLICRVGRNEIFCIFLWKNLEIQGFIIIFVISFGKMHYQNCSLLQKIKQNYLSADKVISDFLQKKPKISLTELRRLIIKVLQDSVLYATERTIILHGSERNCAVIVR